MITEDGKMANHQVTKKENGHNNLTMFCGSHLHMITRLDGLSIR